MTRLPVVSGRGMITALSRIGYVVVRQRGSHLRLRHPTDRSRRPLTVPDHSTLKPGTLRAILRDANLSVDQLRELLYHWRTQADDCASDARGPDPTGLPMQDDKSVHLGPLWLVEVLPMGPLE